MLSPDQAHRVFVRGVNWVGDAVMSTPALSHIRKAFPNATIILHTRPGAAAVFRYNPDIDELWVEDDSASVRAYHRLALRIRAAHFDYGFVFPNTLRCAALMMIGGISERVGNDRRKLQHWEREFEDRTSVLTRAVPVTRELLEHHEVFYYLNIVNWLAVESGSEPSLVLNSGPAEREYVSEMLTPRSGASPDLRIAIAPASINSTAKRWLPERFAEVADQLVEKYNAAVYLIGSKSEQKVIQHVKGLCRRPVTSLCGILDLGQAIAFLENMHLLVGNDSGAMHLAAAFDVPTVAVFGPTRAVNTAPFSTQSRVVLESADCAPCMLRRCPTDHRCMTGVSVARVMSAIEELIPGTGLDTTPTGSR